MNSFYTDIHSISKINICIYVGEGQGARIHHDRKSHGLVIKINGSNKYMFDDGKSMTVKHGDVFYLPKYSNYEVFKIEPGDCICVNFDLTDNDLTYPFFSCTPSSQDYYFSAFSDMLKAWESRTPYGINECMKCLYGIISQIQREQNREYISSSQNKTALYAKEYIDANFPDMSLSVQGLAGRLSVSPEYLRLLFKKAFGISPKKYIISTRIKHAKNLILSGEFSTEIISEMCGFSSSSYFCQEFKKNENCTPSKYQSSSYAKQNGNIKNT